LTAAGLIYAIAQIRKTKSAAQAAEEAAKIVLHETQKSFQKYVIALAHRFINEVKALVRAQPPDWVKAAMRLSDLADQMAHTVSPAAVANSEVDEVRNWAGRFHKYAVGKLKRFPDKEWEAFLARFESRIDSLMRPFELKNEGEVQ